MTRSRVHGFWRATIATVVACIASGLACDGIKTAYLVAREWTDTRIPFVGEADAVVVPLVVCLPPILLAFIIYALLTRFLGPRPQPDAETRCRKCGYILRGISAPRCPECGEQI